MNDHVLVGIGLIIVLGVGLQLIGRTLRFPSIVLLLAGGLVVGPWLGLVEPDDIFGGSLFPVVSLAVGLLLFIGGLELRLSDLGASMRRPVTRLVTLGVLVTWILTTAAAHLLFRQSVRFSCLLAAILVVSGPTVVEPLLRLSRPREPVHTILRWEGIIIDPIGATLSLFCFNAFFVNQLRISDIWGEFIIVVIIGIGAGVVAALLLVAGLRYIVVPDELEVAVALMVVVAGYVAAEALRPEAGLFATTAMGIVLANQQVVPISRLRVFGAPVVSLLIGSLFIVLAAGVDPDAMTDHLPATLALVVILVLVVRPAAVAVATANSPALTWRHRAFLCCMAPRGIVAASTAAFYSLRLEQLHQSSDILVPVTFAVIIALSVIYGLAAIPSARALGVNRPAPYGLVIVSPRPWAIALAREMTNAGVPTVLVARGRWDLVERTDLPFRVFADVVRDLPESGMLQDVRDAVIASPDDETNLVAITILTEQLGKEHVLLLSSAASERHDRRENNVEAFTKRPFSSGVTLEQLQLLSEDSLALRTVDAPGVPPGALMLATLEPGGGWTVRPGPSPVPGTRAVIVDPMPGPVSQVDPGSAETDRLP